MTRSLAWKGLYFWTGLCMVSRRVIATDSVSLTKGLIKLLFSLKTISNYSAKAVQMAMEHPSQSPFSDLVDHFPLLTVGNIQLILRKCWFRHLWPFPGHCGSSLLWDDEVWDATELGHMIKGMGHPGNHFSTVWKILSQVSVPCANSQSLGRRLSDLRKTALSVVLVVK